MTDEPEPQQGVGRVTRPLQPRDHREDGAIEDREILTQLRSVENPEDAERLERLLGDADLIRRLQLLNFDLDSDDWRELAHTKAAYGYGVFVGWCRSGVLRRMASKHGKNGVRGYQRIPEGLKLVGDDAHELSTDLIIQSIDAFRTKTLMHPDPNKRWRADRGASLRTFFVGRCLMELPVVYTKWERAKRRALQQLPEDPELWAENAWDDDYRPETVPHVAAVANLTLDEIDGGIVTAMFGLQAEGYSYAEIAEMINDAGYSATEASVRTRMHRLRKHVQKTRGGSWAEIESDSR